MSAAAAMRLTQLHGEPTSTLAGGWAPGPRIHFIGCDLSRSHRETTTRPPHRRPARDPMAQPLPARGIAAVAVVVAC